MKMKDWKRRLRDSYTKKTESKRRPKIEDNKDKDEREK